MSINDLILKYKNEITQLNETIVNSEWSDKDKDAAIIRKSVISGMIYDLEKLNGEDLKRDEKLFCPKCGCNRLHKDNYSVMCLNENCDYSRAR